MVILWFASGNNCDGDDEQDCDDNEIMDCKYIKGWNL